jgi:hypothetical protein
MTDETVSTEIEKIWNEIHDPTTNNKINKHIRTIHTGQLRTIHTGQYQKIDKFYTQIENDLPRDILFANWYINNRQIDLKNNITNITNIVKSTNKDKCIALYKLFYNTCNEIYKTSDLNLLCVQIMILLEDSESNYFLEDYKKQNTPKEGYDLILTGKDRHIQIYVTSNEIEIRKRIIYIIDYTGEDGLIITKPETEKIKKQKYYTYKLVSQERSEYLYDILSSIQEKAFYYIMNKKQMSRTDNPVKIGMITKTINPNYCNIDFKDEKSKDEGTITKSTGKALIKSVSGPMLPYFKAFINKLIVNNHFDKKYNNETVTKLLVFDNTELQEIYNKYEKYIFANKMPIIKGEDQTQNSNACSQLFMRTFLNTQDETAFLCYCILLYDYYDTQKQDVAELKKYIYSRYILEYAPDIIQKYKDTDKYILLDISKWYMNVVSITDDDIAKSIIGNLEQKKFKLYPPLYKKIALFFENYIQNNATNNNPVLDTKRFNDVYITSDIHADLRKFTQTLINNGIIEIKKSDGTAFNPYSNDIYSPELITNIIWKKNDTLLVIIGDLVDGKRYDKQVDDPEGSFELRLHMFLYNMRIQAMQHTSEVRFTLGNHDIISVLYNKNLYIDYVHDTLQIFYQKNHVYKQNSLFPFYKCSPYLYLALQQKGSTQYEIFCVHGGVDSVKNEYGTYEDITWLKIMQKEYINTIQKTNDITTNTKLSIMFDDGSFEILHDRYRTTNPFYSRMYASSDVETISQRDKSYRDCEDIPKNINMLVVGHCITDIGTPKSRLKQFHDNRTIESQCSGKGCIAYGCKKDGIYRLVFVDTGMARQNNSFEQESVNTYNQNRPIEMLYLQKTENNRGQGNTYEQRRTIAENPGTIQNTIQNTESLDTLVQNKKLGGKKITRKNRLHMKTRRRQKYLAKRPSKKNKRASRKSY